MFSVSLPDESEKFAAGALGARLAVGHQPLGGAEDRDAKAVAHARNLRDGDVLPKAGARYALELADHRLSALRVLEHDAEQRPAIGGRDSLEIRDEIVRLQEARDFEFHFRCRNIDAAM